MENNFVRQDLVDRVLVIELDATHPHNPFSAAMERAVTGALRRARTDDRVGAVVITGGRERSFSVGGDFNEVSRFEGGDEVDRWIDDVVTMYTACLEVDKPTIGALDKFAIGIGFQLALCCDYRIGTPRCQLIMPELEHGIACILGQYMLEKMVGRAHMLRIVIGCDRVEPDEALKLGLLDAVCEPDALSARTRAIARTLLEYPAVAFAVTKRETNSTFVEGLRRITPIAKAGHREAFKDRSAQRFMTELLRR